MFQRYIIAKCTIFREYDGLIGEDAQSAALSINSVDIVPQVNQI